MSTQQPDPPAPSTPTPLGPITTPGPVLRDSAGHPVSFLGRAPPDPNVRQPITIALAATNYPEDAGQPLHRFTHALPGGFVPLLDAAMLLWEALADVEFIAVPDSPTLSGPRGQAAELRVGLADLTADRTPSGGPLLSRDRLTWNDNTDKFASDDLLEIQDPAQRPVVPVRRGDFQYSGTSVSVLSVFVQALGHALGLASNPDDPNSIMNPDRIAVAPDANDIAAVQALYGPPPSGRGGVGDLANNLFLPPLGS